MANSIAQAPTSLDDVAIVRSFITPKQFDKNNDFYRVFSVQTTGSGNSAQFHECKTCFCLIGSVEGHYKACHPDFDLSHHYKEFIYKATRRFAWYGDKDESMFVWYLFGEVVKSA